jgi:hypothetical protein
MRATSERPVLINQAAPGLVLEQRTRPVVSFGQSGAAGGLQRPRGEDRFASRQVRRFAGEFEMTALRAQLAVALDRARRKIPVDVADFFQSEASGSSSFSSRHF